MNAEATVQQFIEKNFLYKKDIKNISSDASLLDAGLIDSVGVFQLATFIETQFSIEVLDEDIVPENFENINAIVAFINAKRK